MEMLETKKILVYRWGSILEPQLLNCLEKINVECIVFRKEMRDYHSDGDFAETFIKQIHSQKIDCVFSYDYFPLLSIICNLNKIPYISWIYDCPMTTLMSKTLLNEYNYIFCFDRIYSNKLLMLGGKHIFHFPLAVNACDFEKHINNAKTITQGKMFYDEVSFIGSLYDGEKNRYRSANFTDYTKGFLEGLVNAQEHIYGYNLLEDVLPDEICSEVIIKCNLELGNNYFFDAKALAADTVGIEITARERIKIVQQLSDKYDFSLYSGSKVDEKNKGKHLIEKGYVDYKAQMPLVFYQSKINLNITSRTIQSGISQRVLDILACGGFCVTNYQPEIAECFEEGVDLVMYTSLADLEEKVAYYLEHDEERMKIAENGNKKVKEMFSLSNRLEEIMEMVFTK